MKVLVAVKRVVDYNVRVRARADGAGADTDGVRFSMNPFDEIAVEEAVRLKESGAASSVTAVSIGPDAAQEVLRTALAMGADGAVLARTDVAVEPLAVAKILRALADEMSPDLILLGKQAIDDDSNQTAQMLAALTGRGQATFASSITVADGGGALDVVREVDGGLETLRVALPAVVSTDLRLNEPRYATLPNIMKARRKPLDIRDPADLGVDVTPRLETLGVADPPARQAGVMVDSVADLVGRLRDEAKMI